VPFLSIRQKSFVNLKKGFGRYMHKISICWLLSRKISQEKISPFSSFRTVYLWRSRRVPFTLVQSYTVLLQWFDIRTCSKYAILIKDTSKLLT